MPLLLSLGLFGAVADLGPRSSPGGDSSPPQIAGVVFLEGWSSLDISHYSRPQSIQGHRQQAAITHLPMCFDSFPILRHILSAPVHPTVEIQRSPNGLPGSSRTMGLSKENSIHGLLCRLNQRLVQRDISLSSHGV